MAQRIALGLDIHNSIRLLLLGCASWYTSPCDPAGERDLMAAKLDPNEIVTLEKLAISNMWEAAALVEILEQKGVKHYAGRVFLWRWTKCVRSCKAMRSNYGSNNAMDRLPWLIGRNALKCFPVPADR